MSPRMVGTHIVAILALLCGSVTADVPMPPVAFIGAGPAVACPMPPQAGPTEMDKAYYYSTIGQELAYAALRERKAEDARRKTDNAGRATSVALCPSPSVLRSPLYFALCPVGVGVPCPAVPCTLYLPCGWTLCPSPSRPAAQPGPPCPAGK
jgi:hypothetical protein